MSGGRTCVVDDCDTPRNARGLCSMHYKRYQKGLQLRTVDVPYRVRAIARFWSRVDVRGPVECWEWQGSLYTATGYGQSATLTPEKGSTAAHRISYEIAHGTIPAGCDIDHLCFNRPCVNPAHLEAVSRSTNLQRFWDANPRTHCRSGHALEGENRIVERSGRVRCRACKLRYQRKYDRNRRAS